MRNFLYIILFLSINNYAVNRINDSVSVKNSLSIDSSVYIGKVTANNSPTHVLVPTDSAGEVKRCDTDSLSVGNSDKLDGYHAAYFDSLIAFRADSALARLYASLHSNDTVLVDTIPTGPTYHKLRCWNDVSSELGYVADTANDQIIITSVSAVFIYFHMPIYLSGGAGTTVYAAVFCNGVEVNEIHDEKKFQTINTRSSIEAMNNIVITEVPCTLDVRVRTDNVSDIVLNTTYGQFGAFAISNGDSVVWADSSRVSGYADSSRVSDTANFAWNIADTIKSRLEGLIYGKLDTNGTADSTKKNTDSCYYNDHGFELKDRWRADPSSTAGGNWIKVATMVLNNTNYAACQMTAYIHGKVSSTTLSRSDMVLRASIASLTGGMSQYTLLLERFNSIYTAPYDSAVIVRITSAKPETCYVYLRVQYDNTGITPYDVWGYATAGSIDIARGNISHEALPAGTVYSVNDSLYGSAVAETKLSKTDFDDSLDNYIPSYTGYEGFIFAENSGLSNRLTESTELSHESNFLRIYNLQTLYRATLPQRSSFSFLPYTGYSVAWVAGRRYGSYCISRIDSTTAKTAWSSDEDTVDFEINSSGETSISKFGRTMSACTLYHNGVIDIDTAWREDHGQIVNIIFNRLSGTLVGSYATELRFDSGFLPDPSVASPNKLAASYSTMAGSFGGVIFGYCNIISTGGKLIYLNGSLTGAGSVYEQVIRFSLR